MNFFKVYPAFKLKQVKFHTPQMHMSILLSLISQPLNEPHQHATIIYMTSIMSLEQVYSLKLFSIVIHAALIRLYVIVDINCYLNFHNIVGRYDIENLSSPSQENKICLTISQRNKIISFHELGQIKLSCKEIGKHLLVIKQKSFITMNQEKFTTSYHELSQLKLVCHEL